MTDENRPARPPYFWLSVAGALVGLTILGMRIATLPESGVRSFLIALAVAVALGAATTVGLALTIRNRMRAAADAFPGAVLIPIVVGTATVVATRWLAKRLGDPGILLTGSRYATLAVDVAGVHVVRSPTGPHGFLAAAAVTIGPLGRTLVGLRELDALVLEIDVGEATAPLPIVPMRLRGNPFRSLTDADLLDVVARIEAALAGRSFAAGWGY